MPDPQKAPQTDPWEEAAKNFKAAPQDGSAPAQGGNDDWRVWQQNTGTETQQPGFFKSLGQTFGLDPDSMKAANAEVQAHPIRSAIEGLPGVAPLEGAYHGGMRIASELGQGINKAKEGNWSGVLQHGISALPFVGPAIDRGVEQMPATTPGESFLGQVKDAATTPGVWGTSVGTAAQIAPLVLGGVDTALPERTPFGAIPTRANATKLFETVAKDAANQPVALTRSTPHLEKILQLSREGGGAAPLPARQLANMGSVGSPRSVPILRQMQNELSGTPPPEPRPLLYPSARNFQSGLASLSREDAGAMGGPMKGQLKQLNHALYEDVHDAASDAGRGDEYVKAMRDYRRASMINSGLKTAAKWGIPAVVGSGIAGKILTSGVGK